MREMYRIGILLMAVGIFVPIVSAVEFGTVIDKVVNGVQIEVGYDAKTLHVDEPVTFDFALYNQTRTEILPFSTLSVVLERDNNALLDTRFQSLSDAVKLPYTFDQAGNYTMDVAFESGSTILAKETLNLNVHHQEGYLMDIAKQILIILLMVVCVAVLIPVFVNFGKKRKK